MLAPGSTHAQVEQALLKEIDRIKSDGVTGEEIARVKQQVLAADAYKRDGTAGVAAEIAEWIAIGDWTLYVNFSREVEQVTAADVQRVARQYLNEDQSTTGWFVPTPKTGEKGS
jgi:zinc protease